MLKVGRIVLLVSALWVVTAATNNAYASTLANMSLQSVNIGSSTFVSKPKSTPKTEAKKEAVIAPTKAPVAIKSEPVTTSESIPAENAPQTPLVEGQNLNSSTIFDLVNQYRAQFGLKAFEKHPEVEVLAQTRAVELISEARTGAIHAGLYNRNLPYWIWENAKYGSDEAGTVNWWINSWLHRHSMLGDYKFSAVACSGNYCVQLFTSFIPKK